MAHGTGSARMQGEREQQATRSKDGEPTPDALLTMLECAPVAVCVVAMLSSVRSTRSLGRCLPLLVLASSLLLLLLCAPSLLVSAGCSCDVTSDTCASPCASCTQIATTCSCNTGGRGCSCNFFGCCSCCGCDSGYSQVRTDRSCNWLGCCRCTTTCQRSLTKGTSICATCQPGRYGTGCQGYCPSCYAGTCVGDGRVTAPVNSTQAMGTCLCQPGWKGSLCQYSRASTCLGRGEPDIYGQCTCDTNQFYGWNCQKQRSQICDGSGCSWVMDPNTLCKNTNNKKSEQILLQDPSLILVLFVVVLLFSVLAQ